MNPLTICSRVALPALVLGVLALMLRHAVLSSAPPVIAGQVAALALAVWARVSFPPGSFGVTATPVGRATIRRGPYRLIRHPMYAAALLFVWASVLGHGSAIDGAIGAAVTLLIVARILVEERLLRARFPDYAEYARSTRAVVPYVL